MPIPLYHVLFLLEADTDLLFEIERLDVQSKEPADVYCWFRFNKANCTLRLLTFISMAEDGMEQQREFAEGRLVFGAAAGTYQPHPAAPPLALQPASIDTLPLATDAAVRAFLGTH